MMTYTRVWPRDLFNEAKLLKCLGRLTLLAHHGKCRLRFEHDTSEYAGFAIAQDPADGALYCTNFAAHTSGGRRLELYTPLNSREPYPLLCCYGDEGCDVLTRTGEVTPEFRAMTEDQPIS